MEEEDKTLQSSLNASTEYRIKIMEKMSNSAIFLQSNKQAINKFLHLLNTVYKRERKEISNSAKQQTSQKQIHAFLIRKAKNDRKKKDLVK